MEVVVAAGIIDVGGRVRSPEKARIKPQLSVTFFLPSHPISANVNGSLVNLRTCVIPKLVVY